MNQDFAGPKADRIKLDETEASCPDEPRGVQPAFSVEEKMEPKISIRKRGFHRAFKRKASYIMAKCFGIKEKC